MPDEDELRMLLRLKRYEQPPPEYFDSFLQDFHRRQRTEMLRQPLWRIVADRVGAFLSEHSMPRYAYGMATAVVIVAGVVAGTKIVSGGNGARQVVQETDKPVPVILDHRSQLTLTGNISPAIATDRPLQYPLDTHGSVQPRYVIDARPVSYEPASSF